LPKEPHVWWHGTTDAKTFGWNHTASLASTGELSHRKEEQYQGAKGPVQEPMLTSKKHPGKPPLR